MSKTAQDRRRQQKPITLSQPIKKAPVNMQPPSVQQHFEPEYPKTRADSILNRSPSEYTGNNRNTFPHALNEVQNNFWTSLSALTTPDAYRNVIICVTFVESKASANTEWVSFVKRSNVSVSGSHKSFNQTPSLILFGKFGRIIWSKWQNRSKYCPLDAAKLEKHPVK